MKHTEYSKKVNQLVAMLKQVGFDPNIPERATDNLLKEVEFEVQSENQDISIVMVADRTLTQIDIDDEAYETIEEEDLESELKKTIQTSLQILEAGLSPAYYAARV